MTYALTTHDCPSTNDDPVAVEPPDEGWRPDEVVQKRHDRVTILWRPPSAVRLEFEGRSLKDVDELLAVLEAADSDRRYYDPAPRVGK